MDLIKDYFLEANPNPERNGCPDEQTLQALAEDRLPVSHPARLHLASCSECFAEYRGYRLAWKEAPKTKPRVNRWAIAAGLAVACGVSFWAIEHYWVHENVAVRMASIKPYEANVDLLAAGTFRGQLDEASPLKQVILPTAIVHLSVTLPRFSQAGRYELRISKDKAGNQIVAAGFGNALGDTEKVVLDVTFDLRAAQPGAYFLAIVRGSDNGIYYYPLKIEYGAP